jgi:transcriptional regulator NrdR family protein
VFSTYETPSLDFLIIKKRSGRHTRYAPHKIIASVFDACGQGQGADGKMRDRGDAAGLAKKILAEVASGKTVLSTKELVRLIGDALESRDRAAFYRYGAFSPHKQEILGL